MAVNSAIASSEVEVNLGVEILWVKIRCVGHRYIYVASCYRPNVPYGNQSANYDLKDPGQ